MNTPFTNKTDKIAVKIAENDPRENQPAGAYAETGKKLYRFKKISPKIAWALIVILILFGLALGARAGISNGKISLSKLVHKTEKNPATVQEKFILEVYQKIKENYWKKISDAELSNLYLLGANKLQNQTYEMPDKNANGVSVLFSQITKEMDANKINEFCVNWTSIVLANLEPFGRSGLFNKEQVEKLSQTVQNINPEKNLYSDIGAPKDADPAELKIAMEKKSADLKKQNTPEAKENLKKLDYAYKVLASADARKRYDTFGAEPTLFSEIISPNVLHLYINRFSPATWDEFLAATDEAQKNTQLDSLVLDLRGNIGGAIDLMPYFLGPFIGQDQYAYEFFHQDERKPFKTLTGWLNSLVQYKKVVILIDGQSQSTAELMASALKRYNVGAIMGEKSKGWGTIERVFDLENQIEPEKQKYGMFLVHTLTLRDDNQPIEGQGVDPQIYLSDKNWQKELLQRFGDKNLVSAVARIWQSKP